MLIFNDINMPGFPLPLYLLSLHPFFCQPQYAKRDWSLWWNSHFFFIISLASGNYTVFGSLIESAETMHRASCTYTAGGVEPTSRLLIPLLGCSRWEPHCSGLANDQWGTAAELTWSHTPYLEEKLNKQPGLLVVICSKTNQHPFYSTRS